MSYTNNRFEKTLQHPGYALETLINGNVSECIDYLRRIKSTGVTGGRVAHEELVGIRDSLHGKYDYIVERVFAI